MSEMEKTQLLGMTPDELAAHENAYGLQMFAHRDGTDGFYVCRMRRVKA